MHVSLPSPRRRAAARPVVTLFAVVLGAGALSGCLAQGATEYDVAQNALGRSTGAIPVPTASPERVAAAAPAATRPTHEAASAKDADESALLAEVAYAPARSEAAEAWVSSSAGSISGNSAIDALIEKHARENGIPPALAYGFVRVESRYNPSARGSGVYGLSQIKPATARGMGFSGPASALFDPDTNLRYGMRYLAGAWQKGGGDVCMAAMKYKGGHRATRMTKSTLSYCAAVKREMAKVNGRSRMPAALLTAAVETRPAELPGVAARPAASAASSAGAAIADVAASPAAAAVTAAPAPESKPAEVASAAAPTADPKGGRVGHEAAAAEPAAR